MSEKQWVCHISGQGEKWELQKHQDPNWASWIAPHTVNGGGLLYLPKSEYRLCDPPEVWRDVTGECTVTSTGFVRVNNSDGTHTYVSMDQGYRLRKVQLETPHKCGKTLASIVWAFVVEQRVTE